MRRLGKKKKIKIGYVYIPHRVSDVDLLSEVYKSKNLAQEEVDILNALKRGGWK